MGHGLWARGMGTWGMDIMGMDVAWTGCYNFLYERLQGHTFGAPGLAAPAMNSEEGREQPRRIERPG